MLHYVGKPLKTPNIFGIFFVIGFKGGWVMAFYSNPRKLFREIRRSQYGGKAKDLYLISFAEKASRGR